MKERLNGHRVALRGTWEFLLTVIYTVWYHQMQQVKEGRGDQADRSSCNLALLTDLTCRWRTNLRSQHPSPSSPEMLPRRNYPFNCWWVAATADEVSRRPLSRWLLEQRVVLFRKEDGTPVALEDRCAHRWAPLSQ